MSKDFTPMYCAALLGLHAFTRCDTTSAFKGIGKVKPLKLLQQKPRYQEVLAFGREHTFPKPIIPEATDDHGWVKRNCQIEPKWSAGDVIPPKLADVLEKMECDDDDEGQDDSETDSDDSEYEEAIPSSDSD
ncbi:hypothetical protein GQR58_001013 [Nymphon striatum]|nr:hypothetical protein GQR58_001013 [Nymphon striatum]